MKDIEDDIPFAVPGGWAWASLSEIANIYTGNSINENEKNKKYSNVSDGLFYIATKDIDFEGVINYENGIKIPFSESKFKIAPAQSSLICIEGGSAGRKIGFINKEVCFVNKLCCLHCEFIDNLYLFYYLRSSTFIDFFNVNKSGLIGGVSLNLLKRIPLPLPPLIEQHRIVTAIETIFTQIDILETNKADLQTAAKQAKSKILDLAIRGKLVPQDPADEPAFVMLERLRAEKEAKIAAGEIKRGKNDSYIYKNSTDNCYYQKYADGCEENLSDEIPFDVPDGWAWCRLPNLCKIPITDGTHQTPTYSDKENGIPFLSSKDVTSRKIDWSKIKYITKELHEELQKRIQPCRNDILLAKNGTTGVAALVDTDKIFDIYVTLAVLRPAEVVHPNYLHYVINSPFCKKQFNGHLTGIGVPNLHLNDICKTIIPLPPLSEQQRIVTKIEELFAQLDCITTTLTE